MRSSLKTLLAGGAILAATAAYPALAGDGPVHVMTVRLPDGTVEHISFTGDVPPRVVLLPAAAVAPMPMISMPVTEPVMAADPFATLERISALMDQQAAAMLRQVAMMPAMTMPGLPPGTSGYSFVATTSGNGVCTRSVRITYAGGHERPQMVSSTTGDCGSGHDPQTPPEVDIKAQPVQPRTAPGVIEARALTSDNSPVRQVAWNR